MVLCDRCSSRPMSRSDSEPRSSRSTASSCRLKGAVPAREHPGEERSSAPTRSRKKAGSGHASTVALASAIASAAARRSPALDGGQGVYIEVFKTEQRSKAAASPQGAAAPGVTLDTLQSGHVIGAA